MSVLGFKEVDDGIWLVSSIMEPSAQPPINLRLRCFAISRLHNGFNIAIIITQC